MASLHTNKPKATHASGTLASGTPHTIHYGQGDKAATMEPSTVGQAPKDVTANLPRPVTPPAPGYLEQAQAMATQAYTTATTTASQAVGAVTGAVGINQASEALAKADDVEAAKKGDERVDGMKDEVVEDYLRSQVPSVSNANQGKS
jgi:hypothetical protein